MDGTWTISELAERAAAALAADGSAQVSGRVRDLPNERLIRWYTTIGLVDPPLGRRGRTALYGPRHLLQLVAVKRRQAAGRSIAEIQLELTGATDTTLERIASSPIHPSAATPAAPEPGNGEAATPTNSTPEPSGAHATSTGTAERIGPPAARMDPSAEFTDPEKAPTPLTDDTDPPEKTAPAHGRGPTDGADLPDTKSEPARATFWRKRPDVSYTEAAVADDYGKSDEFAETRPSVVQGVRLTPGLTLLLNVPSLSGDDLAAIKTAARPLLDELHRRGLVTPAPSPAFLPADLSRRSQ